MIDSIIFDLDGTLWDSTDQIADSWNRTVEKETGTNPKFTGDYLKNFFGLLMADIGRGIFPDLSNKESLALIHKCIAEHNDYLLKHPGILYPDLENTLKVLAKDYKLFIVSNCEVGYIETFLKVHHLDSYFSDHLCPGDTGEAKAENITTIKNKHQLNSPVYVGDTKGDYNACLKSKTPFIFASYGFGEVEHYLGKLNSFADLPAVLANLAKSHI